MREAQDIKAPLKDWDVTLTVQGRDEAEADRLALLVQQAGYGLPETPDNVFEVTVRVKASTEQAACAAVSAGPLRIVLLTGATWHVVAREVGGSPAPVVEEPAPAEEPEVQEPAAAEPEAPAEEPEVQEPAAAEPEAPAEEPEAPAEEPAAAEPEAPAEEPVVQEPKAEAKPAARKRRGGSTKKK